MDDGHVAMESVTLELDVETVDDLDQVALERDHATRSAAARELLDEWLAGHRCGDDTPELSNRSAIDDG
ncbi:hypothetical protein VB773_15555 [Haloarculaceae archaeon H-GB2-1]|nr:hypothetical protein [Haloarculaceae archaeon H-GB1-1]MEA5387371.1 hypothetical protein [Haloarculaceae archaeon H-GB11]MEA5408842.1 hypothetical protein [Haloarculaceae archaeon H-GB2-1]